MRTTAAERAALIRRWERASEWPLMVAAVIFLAAYAVPILHPNLPSWLINLCSSLSWISGSTDLRVVLAVSIAA